MLKKKEPAEYKRTVNFQQFAGSVTCANCHKNIYDSHIRTGHYFTSRPAMEKYIKGSFERGENIFPFNKDFLLQWKKGIVVYTRSPTPKVLKKAARRFDIAVGSGTKGQTFLWWRGNNLFQLPITYFTETNQWCNSPVFPDKVIFVRPVTSRCLECHSTYVNTISPQT